MAYKITSVLFSVAVALGLMWAVGYPVGIFAKKRKFDWSQYALLLNMLFLAANLLNILMKIAG